MKSNLVIVGLRIGLLVLAALLSSTACASLSGYDPSRYVDPPDAAPDPDTAPLPPEQRTQIVDPRSVRTLDASAGAPASSPTAAP